MVDNANFSNLSLLAPSIRLFLTVAMHQYGPDDLDVPQLSTSWDTLDAAYTVGSRFCKRSTVLDAGYPVNVRHPPQRRWTSGAPGARPHLDAVGARP